MSFGRDDPPELLCAPILGCGQYVFRRCRVASTISRPVRTSPGERQPEHRRGRELHQPRVHGQPRRPLQHPLHSLHGDGCWVRRERSGSSGRASPPARQASGCSARVRPGRVPRRFPERTRSPPSGGGQNSPHPATPGMLPATTAATPVATPVPTRRPSRSRRGACRRTSCSPVAQYEGLLPNSIESVSKPSSLSTGPRPYLSSALSSRPPTLPTAASRRLGPPQGLPGEPAAAEAIRDVSLTVRRGSSWPSWARAAREEHAPAHPRRPRPPDEREVGSGAVDCSALGDEAAIRLRRDHIGFVFQFFNLLPLLTAAENVALPLAPTSAGRRRQKLPRRADPRCRRALAQLNLHGLRATGPRRCPAASSSAWRSPARSRPAVPPAGRRTHRQPRLDERPRGHGGAHPSAAASTRRGAGHPRREGGGLRRPGPIMRDGAVIDDVTFSHDGEAPERSRSRAARRQARQARPVSGIWALAVRAVARGRSARAHRHGGRARHRGGARRADRDPGAHRPGAGGAAQRAGAPRSTSGSTPGRA